ncbi:extracellular solute-binding protein [Anaerocolumna sedimenticola]|uniref:Extracellular solute-binding protein n=1 Tax=Anaerocolumna sedimenticola TaxID=2696063 RepID=A0A6P1TSE4_9FIRM|nr:ABC transporter substrate-binding protein [Anaerocolumna sedimenticola]QHQ62358.1 extracellular solute-binding protein [Anaerocolumna sedimenticola]
MKKKVAALLLCVLMVVSLLSGCSKSSGTKDKSVSSSSDTTSESKTTTEETQNTETETPDVTDQFAGEELSILVSAGWMDNRYDASIERFEDTYGVTVDLQTIPADQYSDVLQVKLTSASTPDIFWIQSDPFAIGSQIVEPEKYCIDFTGAEWAKKIPETRLQSGMYNGKLYGLQIWHNSPEYVMLYNKTLFEENGWTIPKTYAELKDLCAKIAAKDITPWFIPGADGWQHQLAFFQIGGVYEAATPGLYDGLNNNTATFAGNEKMLEVLGQFKELSDAGYFGEDWIGTDSTNMSNEFGDRNVAMAMANSSFIKQIKDDTGTADEFGLFLIPLGDNDTFPTNPGGPTMFGSTASKHPDLVKAFFDFCTQTETLQEILDNSPQYTNLDVIDDQLQQHWLPEEEEFMSSIPKEKMQTGVLQTATKYTNSYWMDFGADMIAFCQDSIEANDVLKNMDTNRAEAAKVAKDPNWK